MSRPKDREQLIEAGRLYRAGDLDAAEQIARKVHTKNRRSADALQLLGLIAFQRQEFAEAVRCYRQCMKLSPREPRFPYLIAKVRTMEGNLDEAIRIYDKALRLNPDHHESLTWKAMTYERMGDHDRARAIVEPFVEAATDNAEMTEVYARLEIEAGRPEAAVAAIDRQLASSTLTRISREVLLFVKGKALEKAKDHDAAFAAYRVANKTIEAVFDPDAYVAWVDRIIETFSADRMAQLPRAKDRSEVPVFIAGMPRSGTTLVEQIIDAHPEAMGAGELREFEDIVRELGGSLGPDGSFPECILDLDDGAVNRLGRQYVNQIQRMDRSAKRVVNKSLENYRQLGLVSMLLPGARIIDCRRDPVENCLSCYLSHLMPSRHAYAADLEHLVLVHRQFERLMTHWREVLDLEWMHIEYEKLVADQEAESRRLIDFCGLEWDDRCLSFHESGRVAMTLSYDQVRKPIYTSSVTRSERFEAHIGVLRDGLKPEASSGR